jgi:hypothetical protein
MQRSVLVRLFGLALGVVLAVVAGCNIAGQPCGWLNLSACDSQNTTSGAGGNFCAGIGGSGGFGGFGGEGEGGFGGSDVGTSVGGSDVGVGAGVGGSFGDTVGASVGAGAGDARSSWDEGHVARAPRPRGHRGGIGTAAQAQCPGMPAAWILPAIPASVPLPTGAVTLSTTRLRFICTAQNVGQGQTGVLFSQACGLQFERWVLWTLQFKPNKMLIPSPARKAKTSGLVQSVMPDYLRTLTLVDPDSGSIDKFPNSTLGEVKAVAGSLTPGYSRWQILGLLDAARRAPVTMAPVYPPPPPVVEFVTTGNTDVPASTIQWANLWGVLVVQQFVYEVPAMPNDPNPDLCLGSKEPLNYSGPTNPYGPGWPCSKLTSPPADWVTLIPDDPDPPTVDG